MAPKKVTSSTLSRLLLQPKQTSQDAETLQSIRTVLKHELCLVQQAVEKQGEVKQNDKRQVITVIGDIMDDLLKGDTTLPHMKRRDMINMAVSILWSDPDLSLVKLEGQEKREKLPKHVDVLVKQVDIKTKQAETKKKTAFHLPPEETTAQKIQRAVSTVDLRSKKILRREMSMPAIPGLPGSRGLPGTLPDPDV